MTSLKIQFAYLQLYVSHTLMTADQIIKTT